MYAATSAVCPLPIATSRPGLPSNPLPAMRSATGWGWTSNPASVGRVSTARGCGIAGCGIAGCCIGHCLSRKLMPPGPRGVSGVASGSTVSGLRSGGRAVGPAMAGSNCSPLSSDRRSPPASMAVPHRASKANDEGLVADRRGCASCGCHGGASGSSGSSGVCNGTGTDLAGAAIATAAPGSADADCGRLAGTRFGWTFTLTSGLMTWAAECCESTRFGGTVSLTSGLTTLGISAVHLATGNSAPAGSSGPRRTVWGMRGATECAGTNGSKSRRSSGTGRPANVTLTPGLISKCQRWEAAGGRTTISSRPEIEHASRRL